MTASKSHCQSGSPRMQPAHRLSCFEGSIRYQENWQCGLMRACLPTESLALDREGLVPTQFPLLQCALVFSAYQLRNMLISTSSLSQCEGMDQNAFSFGEVGNEIAFAALPDTSGGFVPCAGLVAKWMLVTLSSRCLFKRRRHSSRLSLRRSALGLLTICSRNFMRAFRNEPSR